MLNKIPNIIFESQKPNNRGIEVITIESLAKRKNLVDHDPQKAHQVAFNMIVFYTEGESKQLVDFVWHTVKKNTIIHLSKGQVNAFQFTNSLKGFIILFTEDYLKKQVNSLPKNEIIRLFNSQLFSPIIEVPSDSNVEEYIHLFAKEYFNSNENYNQENIYSSLHTIIFSKLERLKQYQTFHLKRSDKLNKFLDFKSLLETHFSKSRNADFYAEKLNITYKHLNTICKDIISLTAKQFIDEFIVLEAKRLLVNSEIKSTELAYSLGFEEPTNFVKYFKKHTRFTPNQFKKDYI
ncbi:MULTISPECIES: helix-turn-helix domain-containing protein [Tenacibaculum]|uniref:helix-turn-helix domain-containing protein n=1 Tax=Tenacibaculum TaxID=104267 RepID=UPI001F0A7956|nr:MULTISPECIES: helix-turn-helix domain-containing protein [Tenacibaculum]MCH3885189.1 helix-turn-helix domain-containing protein [Tenacibaculum aquimarinum]MDO6599815.1 helix-turn-helix domain-containing protein [Tenacibaculum sp. 1_MG-2023]